MPEKYRERMETQVTGSLDIVERLQAGRQRLLETKKARTNSPQGIDNLAAHLPRPLLLLDELLGSEVMSSCSASVKLRR